CIQSITDKDCSSSNFYLTPSSLTPAERKAFYKQKQQEYIQANPTCDLSGIPENRIQISQCPSNVKDGNYF
ncbi:hypothetical protein GJ496_004965, partial [Pomphorhynchus laevis]